MDTEAQGSHRKSAEEYGVAHRQRFVNYLGMDLESVPRSEQIAKELLQIVHELAKFPRHRFPGLEALPSVRRFEPARGRPVTAAECRQLAIDKAISETIHGLHHRGERAALEHLFTFDDLEKRVGQRLNLAAEALGVSSGESFRKGREESLLETLASEMCRRELWLSLQRTEGILDPLRMGATPCRLVEQDRAVSITETQPNVQLWEFREVWKFTESTAEPVVAVWVPWTGTGTHDQNTVRALSGPQPEAPEYDLERHRLMAIVPDANPNVAWYFWHLGSWKHRGDEVELRFTQELVDTQGTFVPAISLWTRHDTTVRLLRFRARIPQHMVTNPRFFLQRKGNVEMENGETAPRFLEPEDIHTATIDDDGHLTYRPEPVEPNTAYSLWWGPNAGSIDLLSIL